MKRIAWAFLWFLFWGCGGGTDPNVSGTDLPGGADSIAPRDGSEDSSEVPLPREDVPPTELLPDLPMGDVGEDIGGDEHPDTIEAETAEDTGPGTDAVEENGSPDTGPEEDTVGPGTDAHEETGCVPACDGRQCGDDGCGGTCGSCAVGRCEGLVWFPASQCVDGLCVPSDSLSCDDAIPCTTDQCDAARGCIHQLQESWCLIEDTCRAAGEHAGSCLVCDPTIPWQWSCLDGAPCDDGDGATTDDRCGLDDTGCSCAGRPLEPDPCSLSLNPTCEAIECLTSDGLPGRCGTTALTICQCLPLPPPECDVPQDCLGRTWPIRCPGYWTCQQGQCVPECDGPCGDGVCEPAAGEAHSTCAPDCPPPCLTNEDCPSTDFCEKEIGDCHGLGMCTTRPWLCPLIFDPVCGCNGVTHQNACDAALLGVSVHYRGECRTVCQDIVSDYDAALAAATSCSVAAECHVLQGHCGIGLGACWHVANVTLTQADLDALAESWVANQCDEEVFCRCPPSPTRVECLEGTCVPVTE